MNTNEFTGFRPTSSSKRENPKDSLSGISTPVSLDVPAQSSDYVTQLAEQEGIHSCLPTSLLNGLVHLGVLSYSEALQFQNSFKDRNSDLFTQRNFGERTLTVFAVPTSTVLERLKVEMGKQFSYKVVGVQSLEATEVCQLFEEQLSQGKVVIAGDENHAVLVVGYNREADTFSIRDPYSPKQSRVKKESGFAEEILNGEPWITVLEKTQTQS